MVAIRQRHEVPEALPSARLFLEDIQDILTLSLDAGIKHADFHRTKKVSIVFEVGDKECDTIEDLERIGLHTPTTSDFKMHVIRDMGPRQHLYISKYGAHWTTDMLSQDGESLVYAKVKDIFERAKTPDEPTILELRFKYSHTADHLRIKEGREEPVVLVTPAPVVLVTPEPEHWLKKIGWKTYSAVIGALVAFFLAWFFGVGG